MRPLARTKLGKTQVEITRLGFGAGTLGDRREAISEAQADATLEAAWESGIRFYDTSPWYGLGKSELRVGRILSQKPRDAYALSTKVGRVLIRPPMSRDSPESPWRGGLPFEWRVDYSRDGVLRSFEDSLQRLGMSRIDAVLVHDLDHRQLQTEERVAECMEDLDGGGGFAVLADLRRSGEIDAIGAGLNEIGMIPRFLDRFEMDFFILAMPYTLLEQEALDADLPRCQERGVSVVIGAPFSSGILAIGPQETATYRYQPAPEDVLEKTRRIDAICRRHGVPLGAAALQFPLAHPAVASVIPGPNAPDQVRTNLEWMSVTIPPALWDELKRERLLRSNAPTPE